MNEMPETNEATILSNMMVLQCIANYSSKKKTIYYLNIIIRFRYFEIVIEFSCYTCIVNKLCYEIE